VLVGTKERNEVEPIVIGIIGIVLMLIMLGIGIHVAIVLFLVGFFGCAAIVGFGAAGAIVYLEPFEHMARYEMSVIPLFILMGYFAFYGGISHDAYNVASLWTRNLPGGLALATTIGCGAFAAANGSSLATAAIFTKISLPEMLKRGYSKELAAGAIAASGTLAALIPPSAILVIYGIFTEQSIGKLLIAGVIPGIMSIIIYISGTVLRCKLNTSLAPLVTEPVSWKEKLIALKHLWAIMAIFVLVIGGLYAGIFTPTEAGAIGALGAFIIILGKRRLTASNLKEGLIETGVTSATVLFIIAGAMVFGKFIVLSQLASTLMIWLSELTVPPLLVIIGFMAMYIIMGMFFDAIAMLAITLPIVAPIVESLGFSGIWFGILVVKIVEMAVISPPFGMNVYIVHSTAGGLVTMEQIFKGVGFFLILDVITLVLLIGFPQITLVLPNMM